MRLPLILTTAAAALAACGNLPAQAQDLSQFEGIWEVNSRGPGNNRGGPPGGVSADGVERFGPSRGERPEGRRGPPPGERGDGLRGPPPGGPPRQAGPVEVEGLDVEGLDEGDARTYSLMTEAGKAAFRAMDPHDLPANNCMSNGLPSLVGIPDVQDWHVEGDKLTIHYANFNTRRTIWLDGRPASGAPTLYGHSTGRFDGDTFIVSTTNLTATPGGLGRNAPGSASRTIEERYRLVDGRVTGSVTIHDPEYLTRDFQRPIAFVRAPNVTEIPEIPCSVEAACRYLDG